MKIIHPIINIRKVADLPFNARMGQRGIGLYAMSSKAALQRAIEYFQPKRSERGTIIIEPAEASCRKTLQSLIET